MIIAHTVKGKGISFMENKLEWHYKSPNQEQYEIALKELGEIK
jgi:transketolase